MTSQLCTVRDEASLDRALISGLRRLIAHERSTIERPGTCAGGPAAFVNHPVIRSLRSPQAIGESVLHCRKSSSWQLSGTTSVQQPTAVVTLLRDKPFSEREAALLSLLLPHLATAEARLRASAAADLSQADAGQEAKFRDWLRSRTSWKLSQREGEVLFWLCQGKRNEEIGTILGITRRTAETHTLRIYPKIGVENRYAAIATVSQIWARHGQPSGSRL